MKLLSLRFTPCFLAAARLLVASASAIACNLNSRLYEWFFLMDSTPNDKSEEDVDDEGVDDDDVEGVDDENPRGF